MTENNQNQEAAVRSDDQQPQQPQPPQAEPIKPRGAKLRETAERLRAANQKEAKIEQPEQAAEIARDLPGPPPENRGEGDNYQPAKDKVEIDDAWAIASNELTGVLRHAMATQEKQQQQILDVREMQARKTIELFEVQNAILGDIKTIFEKLLIIAREILAFDKVLDEQIKKAAAKES